MKLWRGIWRKPCYSGSGHDWFGEIFERLRGWTLWVVAAVCAAFSLQTMELVGAMRFGLNIYPLDLAAIVLSLLVGKRFLKGAAVSRGIRILVAILLFSLIEFVVGVSRYGTTAGVDSRHDFFVLMLT